MNDALAGFGVDVASLIAGLIGCIVVQTLFPKEDQIQAAKIALVTLGSILFASLSTPLAFAWLQHAASFLIPPGQEHQARAATAAALGGFARPILLVFQALFRKFVKSKLKEG